MARRFAGRFGYPEAPNYFDVTLHPDRLKQPSKWKKPRMVFVPSMGDLFHEDVPLMYIRDVWTIMARARHHTYQVLTKRPKRAAFFINQAVDFYGEVFDHVWLGVTAENQATADERIPLLLQTPAAVQFVSVEPMLEAIDFDYHSDTCHCGVLAKNHRFETHSFVSALSSYLIDGIDWVICGAETGPGKRPMQLDWARSLRDQCQAAGVPFFFKRDGNGNRELDGRLWEEFPR